MLQNLSLSYKSACRHSLHLAFCNLAIPLQNYFDEQNRRVDIIVPQNAVETYDSSQHQKDEYNKMAFSLMEQAGIQLVKKYKGGKKYEKK